MRGMHSSTSHFKNVFDVYNFSIVLNLFESNKPSALSSENMALYSETFFYMRFTTIYAIFSSEQILRPGKP